MLRTTLSLSAAAALALAAGSASAASVLNQQTLASGHVITTYDDGSTKTETPDGYVITRDAEGWVRVTHPDGAKTTVMPDGTSFTKYPNGDMTIRNTDGCADSCRRRLPRPVPRACGTTRNSLSFAVVSSCRTQKMLPSLSPFRVAIHARSQLWSWSLMKPARISATKASKDSSKPSVWA